MYRNNNGLTTIFILVWIIAFGHLIVSLIRLNLFPESQYSIFGGYLLSLLIIGLFIFMIVVSTRYLKNSIKKRRINKINNVLCKHGIKGGMVLELCADCKKEKERERLIHESQRKEQEIKDLIRQNALELRNQEIKKFLRVNLSSKDFLYKVSPNEFEDIVAEMYKKFGYDVKQTPYSNDRGKDIILKKGKVKYLVECKKYDPKNTIGREALQKFFAAIIEEKAEKGFFVTTSDYKSTAIKYAKDIEKIELINGSKLVLMMREVYPENYDSNLIRVMCKECGDIVVFSFDNNGNDQCCRNDHVVINDFSAEILSPKYLNSDKYCVKCGKSMKLVHWKKKHFWGCSDYPQCKSYQRYSSIN